MLDKIILSNIRVYAYHGCLDEESKIGSNYRVDVEVDVDLELSSNSDKLKDTVDYVILNQIVKQEMSIPSKLLEHVAQRINSRVFKEFSKVKRIKTQVAKLNPPIIGDVESVSVKMIKRRE
ncbi:dihydroneopterin aldolase [Flavobacterium sp. CS20]|uniref:dihydroneopterin aldolase n=1 Tax=Flavobacterium sp. CS20 TaxID=2775246 RepID=UPI001B3A2BB9|nr:dihydroneopterin aldolase [Flavobacterium sp. CS20]QTY26952.1 dihydroneopterin aldolase [Flavobacterium sp. CS20]